MKIVYCIAGTYNSGGMERVLANKANHWIEKGHEVCIITTDQRGQQPFFPLDSRIKLIDLGINYELNNGKSFWNKAAHYPVKQVLHQKRLQQVLKTEKADIVVSMFCNDASFLPKIKDGSKKVLEVHFSRFKRLQYARKGLWKLADTFRSWNDEKVASRFDQFIVLTEEDSAYWGNLKNMQVIPNARSFYSEEPAKLDAKKVIAVGRYSYQKGLDRLLMAWKEVIQQVPGWKLHLVGDGELREQLAQMCVHLGIQDSVILGKAEKQMKEVYQEASVLVLTSHYEGLPMVLLEAQAVGLPIVSFACKCGPKDVIENGRDGFLVPEGDVKGLTEKLVQVMKDEQLRKDMGRSAFKRSERYAVDVVMQKWEDLFSNLLNS